MTQDKSPRKKKMALGRGLSALLGDNDLDADGRPVVEARAEEKIIQLPVEALEPNPYQPRRNYDSQALRALADSIREHGVLQPLVVRPSAMGYQIIAGERRFRASQMAGLTKIPVVVRQATDQQALLLALLENLQREDLNPLEEAAAYQRLTDEFELSHDEIAKGVGKDRSTVANAVRLLRLPEDVKQDVNAGRLSAGHARALLALESRAAIRAARDQIIRQGLSVRATERLVKAMLGAADKPARTPSESEVHLESLGRQLTRGLGMKVNIRGKAKGKGGRVTIEYFSDHDLQRLLDLLK